ncbi:hypothetical protein [Paenibacillus sp. FSL M7-0831]|uniref:hypothetical protein n=1 Tax=Paenibacillus sp. FSL M7-0831 TaxID=2975314 RepID=UPI0030FC4436
MASISISELKPGIKLEKDVHTPLGGLLMRKARFSSRAIWIFLRAFMVPQVEVDMGEAEPQNGFSNAVAGRGRIRACSGRPGIADQNGLFL